MKMNDYEAIIEAALFVAGEAVPLSSLAEIIEMDKAQEPLLIRS